MPSKKDDFITMCKANQVDDGLREALVERLFSEQGDVKAVYTEEKKHAQDALLSHNNTEKLHRALLESNKEQQLHYLKVLVDNYAKRLATRSNGAAAEGGSPSPVSANSTSSNGSTNAELQAQLAALQAEKAQLEKRLVASTDLNSSQEAKSQNELQSAYKELADIRELLRVEKASLAKQQILVAKKDEEMTTLKASHAAEIQQKTDTITALQAEKINLDREVERLKAQLSTSLVLNNVSQPNLNCLANQEAQTNGKSKKPRPPSADNFADDGQSNGPGGDVAASASSGSAEDRNASIAVDAAAEIPESQKNAVRLITNIKESTAVVQARAWVKDVIAGDFRARTWLFGFDFTLSALLDVIACLSNSQPDLFSAGSFDVEEIGKLHSELLKEVAKSNGRAADAQVSSGGASGGGAGQGQGHVQLGDEQRKALKTEITDQVTACLDNLLAHDSIKGDALEQNFTDYKEMMLTWIENNLPQESSRSPVNAIATIINDFKKLEEYQQDGSSIVPASAKHEVTSLIRNLESRIQESMTAMLGARYQRLALDHSQEDVDPKVKNAEVILQATEKLKTAVSKTNSIYMRFLTMLGISRTKSLSLSEVEFDLVFTNTHSPIVPAASESSGSNGLFGRNGGSKSPDGDAAGSASFPGAGGGGNA